MKRVLFLFLVLLLLSSCRSAETPQALPTTTSTLIPLQPTYTVVPPTVTFTSIPLTPTPTPEICDPLEANYCITDGHFIFQRPVHAPANMFVDITYRYGSTANRTRDPHNGVEFQNSFGTPIYAAGDGVVVFAGADDEAIYSPWQNYYGNLIVIQHADHLYTLYAHLSKVDVGVNQSIGAGEKIGEIGQSGSATGPHLHFEVRQGDGTDYFSSQNPELWLVPNTGENGQPLGAIQIAIQSQDGELARFAEVTLQKYDDQNQLVGNTLYSVTYDDAMLKGDENIAMGDLPAGKYRIAMQYSGWYRERWVEVKSGKLTQVILTVK